MSRTSSGGHGHRVWKIGQDHYRMAWFYDVKHGRIRYPRQLMRDTDRAGAERFAKRWGVTIRE